MSLNSVRKLCGGEIPSFMKKALVTLAYREKVTFLKEKGAMLFTDKGFTKIGWNLFRKTQDPDAGSIWTVTAIKNDKGEEEKWLVAYVDEDNNVLRKVKASIKKTAQEEPLRFRPSKTYFLTNEDLEEMEIEPRKGVRFETDRLEFIWGTYELVRQSISQDGWWVKEVKLGPPYGETEKGASTKISHTPGTIVQITVPHGNLYEKYNGKIGEVVAAVPDRSKVSFKDMPPFWFEDNVINPIVPCPLCNANVSLQMLKKVGKVKCKCNAFYTWRQLEKIANNDRINKVAAEKIKKIADTTTIEEIDLGGGKKITVDYNNFDNMYRAFLTNEQGITESAATRNTKDEIYEWVEEKKTELKKTSTKTARIEERKGEYCVIAESGRSMGCYSTKPEAEKRLDQVEMFKHMKGKKAQLTEQDPDYIPGCPACEEAVKCGLDFEETHSTGFPGFLQLEDPDTGKERLIPSPHYTYEERKRLRGKKAWKDSKGEEISAGDFVLYARDQGYDIDAIVRAINQSGNATLEFDDGRVIYDVPVTGLVKSGSKKKAQEEHKLSTEEIMQLLESTNTGGYFYADNCRINYSSVSGWYCKDFIGGEMDTYNITEDEARRKIEESLGDGKFASKTAQNVIMWFDSPNVLKSLKHLQGPPTSPATEKPFEKPEEEGDEDELEPEEEVEKEASRKTVADPFTNKRFRIVNLDKFSMGDFDIEDEEEYEELLRHNNKYALVTGIAILGWTLEEYYVDVRFDDDYIITGLSVYHLEGIKEASTKTAQTKFELEELVKKYQKGFPDIPESDIRVGIKYVLKQHPNKNPEDLDAEIDGELQAIYEDFYKPRLASIEIVGKKIESIVKEADGMESLRGGGQGGGSSKLEPMQWNVQESKYPPLPKEEEEEGKEVPETEEVEKIIVEIDPESKSVHVNFKGEKEGEKEGEEEVKTKEPTEIPKGAEVPPETKEKETEEGEEVTPESPVVF